MLKFSLTRETKEELVELNSKLEKTLKRINSIEQFQLDACKMLNSIEHFQLDAFKKLNKNDDDLKKYLVNEIAKNKIDYDTMLKLNENTTNGDLRQLAKLKLNMACGKFDTKSDFSKMLESFPYNHWLNDFEVAMVEKALNIQLYPWQKEFLKGSNCVNINRGSGKTFIFTLAYTLKLITLPMFINYDNDVHRCLVSALYHNTEVYIGEMFIDFYEKLSVYPFKLNTTLKLVKEWSV